MLIKLLLNRNDKTSNNNQTRSILKAEPNKSR